MGPQIQLEAEDAKQRSAEIVTVDLLPVETRLGTHDAHATGPLAVGAVYRATVMGAMTAALGKRRYRLASIIDRAGNYSVGKVRRAMTEDELSAALVDLDAHAEAQSRSPERLVPLTLRPAPGSRTGSHATLYVGGDAFVGNEQFDMADFFATLAAINTVVTAVATVGEATRGDDTGDKIVRATDTAAYGMATTAELLDAAGAAADARPVPRVASHLRLVLTLIDNRSGSILWHFDRTYPYNPSSPTWIRRAIELSLRKVPRGGGPSPRVRRHW